MDLDIAEILLCEEENKMLTEKERIALFAARDAWKHGHPDKRKSFMKNEELKKIYIREMERELEAMKDYSLESARNWLFIGNIHGLSGMEPNISLDKQHDNGSYPAACVVAYKIGYHRGRLGKEICDDARNKMERGSRYHSPYSHHDY